MGMYEEHLMFLEDDIYKVKNEDKNGRITISRPSSGHIEIVIRDNTSRINFATLSLTPHEYAQLLTGLSEVPCVLETKGLNNVGKKKVSKQILMVIPKMNTWEIKEIEKWCKAYIGKYFDEEGNIWFLSQYFSSRNMHFDDSDEEGMMEVLLNYSRYVEVK